MTNEISKRLEDLGITLPVAAAPAANYVPYVISGNTLYLSGQLPMEGGKVAVVGRLGAGMDIEAGQAAARLCAINILAQVKAHAGDLEKVRPIKLVGFVNVTVPTSPTFPRWSTAPRT
jgi:enamine deaminase RidA (YjgF/YER057c/UK114 family)